MTSSAFTDEEFCALAREEISVSVALLNYKNVPQIKVSVLCESAFLSVRFRPEEGLTVETSVLKLFAVANLRLSTQLLIVNHPVIFSHRRNITVSLGSYPIIKIVLSLSLTAIKHLHAKVRQSNMFVVTRTFFTEIIRVHWSWRLLDDNFRIFCRSLFVFFFSWIVQCLFLPHVNLRHSIKVSPALNCET